MSWPADGGVQVPVSGGQGDPTKEGGRGDKSVTAPKDAGFDHSTIVINTVVFPFYLEQDWID